MKMDTLWAPWRIGYVTGDKPSACVFCVKPDQHVDRQNLILFRGEFCFIILNIYPYNNGHLMIVPYEHLGGLEDLSSSILGEMMALTQQSIGVLTDRLHPTGYNIGINQGGPAGAGVADHIHLHIVPRWVGDTNFMPVIADTRVMPQSLESSYDLLVGGFVPG